MRLKVWPHDHVYVYRITWSSPEEDHEIQLKAAAFFCFQGHSQCLLKSLWLKCPVKRSDSDKSRRALRLMLVTKSYVQVKLVTVKIG